MTASQMLDRFGFAGGAQWTPVGELSGGERRRLQLLRLLMDGPNVLILDEPTNDLDVETLTVARGPARRLAGHAAGRQPRPVLPGAGDRDRRRPARRRPAAARSPAGSRSTCTRGARPRATEATSAGAAAAPQSGPPRRADRRRTAGRPARRSPGSRSASRRSTPREAKLHTAMADVAAEHEKVLALDAELRTLGAERSSSSTAGWSSPSTADRGGCARTGAVVGSPPHDHCAAVRLLAEPAVRRRRRPRQRPLRRGGRLGHPTGLAVWWSASRPEDGGRTDVTAAPPGRQRGRLAAARRRRAHAVHEYGGGRLAPVVDLAGVRRFADSRLYRVDAPGADPVVLTPPPAGPHAERYADLEPVGESRGALRPGERTAPTARSPGRWSRCRCSPAPRDGGLCQARDFLAAPRALAGRSRRWRGSAGTTRDMPWDSTEAVPRHLPGRRRCEVPGRWPAGGRVAVSGPSGTPRAPCTSVSDASGWWNLLPGRTGSGLDPLWPVEQECGMPLWLLGRRTFLPLGPRGGGARGPGRAAARSGHLALDLLDPATGSCTRWACRRRRGRPTWPPAAAPCGAARRRDDVPAGGAGGTSPTGVRRRCWRPPRRTLPDPAWLPVPRAVEVPSARGRVTHAHVYPPTSPEAVGRRGRAAALRDDRARRPDRAVAGHVRRRRRATSPRAGSAWSTWTTAAPPATAAPTGRCSTGSGASWTCRTAWPWPTGCGRRAAAGRDRDPGGQRRGLDDAAPA